MSKILVLGRTMDMGGTEVAMAALLQKLVEKKEDVTLLLVEKRGVLLERIPKEVEVRQMIWDKKPHPALERIVGKRETPAERSFYARGMGVFLMRVVYGKKRYGKLYERILECVEPETKQYDLVFDFFGFGAFTTAFGARKTNARKKAVWFHGENLWWLFRTRDFIPEYDKIYCVSEPVRKQVIARFPELADRTEVLLNFIDIKQVQRRSEEPLSDPQYTGELKFLTVGRASEEKGYDIAVQITAELKKRGLCFKWFIIGDGRDLNKLRTMAKEYQVEQEIIFLGMRENPAPYVKSCDLYLQPSRHKGYPITIVEARSLQKVIIASDIPSMREQIRDGENGYLCPLDVMQFADKIQKVIADQEGRDAVRKKLREEPIDFSAGYAQIEAFAKK